MYISEVNVLSDRKSFALFIRSIKIWIEVSDVGGMPARLGIEGRLLLMTVIFDVGGMSVRLGIEGRLILLLIQ